MVIPKDLELVQGVEGYVFPPDAEALELQAAACECECV